MTAAGDPFASLAWLAAVEVMTSRCGADRAPLRLAAWPATLPLLLHNPVMKEKYQALVHAAEESARAAAAGARPDPARPGLRRSGRQRRRAVTSFSKWDRDAYRACVGEEEAARRRGAIMAGQWGYQLAEQRRRLGFTQAGLAEIMGVTPGRVSQIEHGEVSTVEALASYVAALGGKLELIADIGGHLLKMPANPAA